MRYRWAVLVVGAAACVVGACDSASDSGSPAASGGDTGTGGDVPGGSANWAGAMEAGSGGTGGIQPGENIFVDRVVLEDGCLPRQLPITAQHRLVEVTIPSEGCLCSTDEGRADPDTPIRDAVIDQLRELGDCDGADTAACESACLCVLTPVAEDLLQACLTEPTVPAGSRGWCYIDTFAGIGDPALIQHCESGRAIRFLGVSTPADDAQVMIAIWGG